MIADYYDGPEKVSFILSNIIIMVIVQHVIILMRDTGIQFVTGMDYLINKRMIFLVYFAGPSRILYGKRFLWGRAAFDETFCEGGHCGGWQATLCEVG